METKKQVNYDDINSLREEIANNEVIIENYIQTAQNMKVIGIPTFILSIFLFFKAGLLFGFIGLFLAFICLRKYNQSVGMADVYYGVTKFLKFMYHKEVTGDTSMPGFLQGQGE